jgi:hypothetical protein
MIMDDYEREHEYYRAQVGCEERQHEKDGPECSGDPIDCLENEGRGCCRKGSGHQWDRSGERCILCGDKDWAADKARAAKQDRELAEEIKRGTK